MPGCRFACAGITALLLTCSIAAQDQPKHRQPGFEQRQTRLWLAIKKALTSPNGAKYFDQNLRYAEVPGGAEGVGAFHGTVISSEPADRPDELMLAISGSAHPEARLLLKTVWREPIPSGTEVEFSGILKTFTADPFLLTFDLLRFEILNPAQKGAHKRK